MLSHPKPALNPRPLSFTQHFVQPHNHYEEHKMKHPLENLFYLSLGLVLFYALNQHYIGHSAVFACQSIQHQQNNFIAEIGIIAFICLCLFGTYFLWKTAPIFSVSTALILVIGLGYMQNQTQGKSFNFAQAKVEKVWGAK
jgi:hypothetical protein